MTSSKTGQITIRSIGAGGDGVANLPDGQIYVPFTLPGEVVNVARDKNRATLMALLEASPERQNPAAVISRIVAVVLCNTGRMNLIACGSVSLLSGR